MKFRTIANCNLLLLNDFPSYFYRIFNPNLRSNCWFAKTYLEEKRKPLELFSVLEKQVRIS